MMLWQIHPNSSFIVWINIWACKSTHGICFHLRSQIPPSFTYVLCDVIKFSETAEQMLILAHVMLFPAKFPRICWKLSTVSLENNSLSPYDQECWAKIIPLFPLRNSKKLAEIHTINGELRCICSQHHITVITRPFHFLFKGLIPSYILS